MELEGSIIETGVDKLVKLVKERGRILLADAAKELGVSTTVIQEWVDFLEEEGIISIEYRLTKPFLVERKLTKKELDEKAKEFAGKKDVFVRKAEVSLSFLEKQGEELKNVKADFDRLKSDIGIDLEAVKKDLKELEKCQQMKVEMQKQLEDQKNDAKLKIEELTRDIMREQKRYEELIADLNRENDKISKERLEAKSIEESENLLNKKMAELKIMVNAMEKRVSDEDSAVKNSEEHIDRLNSLMGQIKSHVDSEKSAILPLIKKSEESEKKIIQLQQQISEKILQQQKNSSKESETKKKIEDFFEKRLTVMNLIDKVNKDRNELEKTLMELIKKAKSFELTAKNGNLGKEMVELENKFNEVDKRKSMFHDELKKLVSFFK